MHRVTTDGQLFEKGTTDSRNGEKTFLEPTKVPRASSAFCPLCFWECAKLRRKQEGEIAGKGFHCLDFSVVQFYRPYSLLVQVQVGGNGAIFVDEVCLLIRIKLEKPPVSSHMRVATTTPLAQLYKDLSPSSCDVDRNPRIWLNLLPTTRK